MQVILFGIAGLIVGSFLNVLILRWGKKTLRGRSECMSCGRQLWWFDMIPVVSWIVLKARCRHCGKSISIQYPLVEITTAILFALLGATWSVPGIIDGVFIINTLFIFLPYFAIVALLIAIAAYDIRHTIIPDAWVYSFMALALIADAFTTSPGQYGLTILAGPIAALPLFSIWLISRGAWMGFGDVKLALGIGWLLGPVAGLVAIFLAFVIGAAASIQLLIFSSQAWKEFARRFTPTPAFSKLAWGFTMKSEIPFGPFLIAACLIVWFMQMYSIPLPLALW